MLVSWDLKMKKDLKNSFPPSSTALSTYLLLSPASEAKGRCTEGSGHKQFQTVRETGYGDLGQQNKKGTDGSRRWKEESEVKH